MTHVDLETNRKVRAVLVRHWVDLGRLSIRTQDGKLFIQGGLHRIVGVAEALTPPIVDTIFDDIRRIREVVRMTVLLENWSNESGRWLPSEPAAAPQTTPLRAPGPTSFSLTSTPAEGSERK